MSNYDAINFIIFKGIFYLIISIVFFNCIFFKISINIRKFKIEYRKYRKNIKQEMYERIIAFIFGILFLVPAIQSINDYMIRDYQKGEGTIIHASNTATRFSGNRVSIDDTTYYFPNRKFLEEYEGKECNFIYTKRTKVILEINITD